MVFHQPITVVSHPRPNELENDSNQVTQQVKGCCIK